MLQKLLENIDVLIESNDRWRIERDDIRRRIGVVLDEIKESGYKCNAPRMRDPKTNKILPRTEKEKRERSIVSQLFILLNIMDRPVLYEIEKYAVSLRSKATTFVEMDDTLKNRRYIRDELVEVYHELERLIKTVDDTKHRLLDQVSEFEREVSYNEHHLRLTRRFCSALGNHIFDCKTHLCLLRKTISFFAEPPESPPHL